MNRTIKHLICLILTSSLAFFAASCSKTPASADMAVQTADHRETGSESLSSQKVTLSILSTNLGVAVPGVQDDHVAEEIERKTGVTMNITNVMGDAITPKILAMNASGDLPDLFTYDSNIETLKTLIDSDSLYDCSSLIDSRLTNFLSNRKLKFALNFSRKYWSGKTGKLFSIPLNVGITSSPSSLTAGTFIRWDYYKELGYPKVTDIMDLLPVLKQIQDRHPRTTDGKPAYGVSFWNDWNTWPVTVFGFVDGYSEGGDFGTIDISDEKFIPILDKDSVFWKYITFYNKARQMGILDPDSFTQKFEQWSVKVAAGQEYFIIPGWLTSTFAGGPGEGYALIDTTGSSDKCYSKFANSTGMFSQVISKDCKSPERALDLINFFASDEGIRLLNNGVKGEVWDFEGDRPVFKPDILRQVLDPLNTEAEMYGYKKYNRLAALAPGEKDSNGYFFDLTYESDYIKNNQTSMEKDCARFYGVSQPSDIYNRKKYTTYSNTLMAAMPGFEEASYNKKADNITRYISENWAKLVMAQDDAAFQVAKDKFINDLKALDWDKVLAKFMENYNQTKSELDGLK